MRMSPPANLLITGPPGIGKTTVLERVLACLPPAAATGFLTREVRARGVRQGFAIETLDGHTAPLASVHFDAGPRVGRYRVRVAALDAVAVPALAPRPGVRLIVVDEIGKMESLSSRFADAVRAALDSPVPVLGTIARSGGALIAEVRRRPDVTLVEVTHENRYGLPAKIAGMLRL
ncbi:MAG TPA: nucleoside-triphosphatase [Candidatus Limnocylindria bacterium]|nr:nucleoside-triphosphatase [Candidatus Limnocylindria bacterium]